MAGTGIHTGNSAADRKRIDAGYQLPPHGTGYGARREDISLAGKTGTAEIKLSKMTQAVPSSAGSAYLPPKRYKIPHPPAHNDRRRKRKRRKRLRSRQIKNPGPELLFQPRLSTQIQKNRHMVYSRQKFFQNIPCGNTYAGSINTRMTPHIKAPAAAPDP